MLTLFVRWEKNREAEKTGNLLFREQRLKTLTAYSTAANELDQAATLVGLVCANGAKTSVRGFALYTGRVARDITQDKLTVFDNTELMVEKEKVMAALRKEMGIEAAP